jgi:hypothetical protein
MDDDKVRVEATKEQTDALSLIERDRVVRWMRSLGMGPVVIDGMLAYSRYGNRYGGGHGGK